MRKNFSIEYAHIYTNQRISDEHKLSLKVLDELRDELKQKGQSYSLVVMVDDYSFPDPSFDYDTFIVWAATHGHEPDLVIRESQLIPLCDQVIQVINSKQLKDQLTEYIKANKYPCSLFIATWYLLRLGYIKGASVFPGSLVAERLLNILPKSFQPFEDKALEIIASTPYAEAKRKIDYRFFEGRIVY